MKKIGVGSLFKSRETNRYLFIMRTTKSYNGQFGLVGGKVQKGESIQEGLCREIFEEIGFIPEIEKMVRFSEFISDDKQFWYYSALIVVEKEFIPILNSESNGYAWVKLSNLPRPMHPRVKELFNNEYVVESIERF